MTDKELLGKIEKKLKETKSIRNLNSKDFRFKNWHASTINLLKNLPSDFIQDINDFKKLTFIDTKYHRGSRFFNPEDDTRYREDLDSASVILKEIISIKKETKSEKTSVVKEKENKKEEKIKSTKESKSKKSSGAKKVRLTKKAGQNKKVSLVIKTKSSKKSKTGKIISKSPILWVILFDSIAFNRSIICSAVIPLFSNVFF